MPIGLVEALMDDGFAHLSRQVGAALAARGEWLATAESCTGGWVAQALTDIAGSSAWFERGFVTYANAAKIEMLGVTPEILANYGAVSCETASAMAAGALRHAHVDWALAITGIAGPSGGSIDKPVGTVCFAWASKRQPTPDSEKMHFDGDRRGIRLQAVRFALNGLLHRIETQASSG